LPADPPPDRRVEEELEELGDPEGSPALPAATLAASAAHRVAPRGAPGAVRHDSYREIWALAWPFMLNMVLVNLVGLVDIAMVGRLGSDAVAAVGYASQLFSLSQSVLIAVGAACVALMARAIGASDPGSARAALGASLGVGVATALGLIAIIVLPARTWLELLAAEPHIAEMALPYLQMVLGSSLPLAAAIVVESAMRADKDTRRPMLISAAVMVVKLGLNSVLIFGAFGLPRLELVGAGLATVTAQGVGLVLFAALVVRAPGASPLALRRGDLRAGRHLVRDLVRISLPGVGERLAMNLALLAYFRILSDYGPLTIAAYTVGVRILSFSWIPGIGFGVAASTLVGQSLGGGTRAQARRAGWRATRLSLGVAVALGLLCAWAREPLAGLLTSDATLIAELGPFLLCLAVAQPFLQSHFALGGAHRGAGDTFTPFVAATVSNWALRVPLAWVVAQPLGLDVVWVWYTLVVDHLARAAWLAWSFRRGRWAGAD
jgi:putative MATE family efflux protein